MEDKILVSILVNGKEYAGTITFKDLNKNTILESARELLESALRTYCRDKFKVITNKRNIR
jgi:small nuclear ribonucleoprotein (snRNP)-like protein